MARLPDISTRVASLDRVRGVSVHARCPRWPGRRLAVFAEQLRAAAPNLPLFVNDRADVALAVGAQGVHLPAEGLPTPVVRAMVGDATWIGRSTHSDRAAREAVDAGADYVFLGPIWDTPSHPDRPGIGVNAIAQAQPARVIAIGGIRPDRVIQCVEAGAYGVAAISALWSVSEPGSVAREMLLLLDRAQR